MKSEPYTEKTVMLTREELIKLEFAAFKGGISLGMQMRNAALEKARQLLIDNTTVNEEQPGQMAPSEQNHHV